MSEDPNVIPIGAARKAKPKPDPKPRRDLEEWEESLLEKLLVVTKEDPETGKMEPVAIRSSAANVATILQHHPAWAGVIALNLFHLRIETTRTPPWHPLDAPKTPKLGTWGDADTSRLCNWFARTWICNMPPLTIGPKTIDAALLVAAEANTFHPVRDYIFGCGEKWDGEKRIDTWIANYLGGEVTAYACAVGAAFLIGLVARVMAPGCKLDTMIVLEGKQGRFKSTALEALTSPWFADSRLPISDKDGMQNLAGVWLWEIAELAGLSKTDVETTKAFLSSRSDRYRPSHMKHTTDVPRQTVLAGSTNAGAYLQDETGGRRFHPVRVGDIKIAALRADRDQLWAEAFDRYKRGERWWLDDALTKPEQDARYVEDEWQSRIASWLADREETTVAEILGSFIFAELDKDGMVKNSMGRWGQREQNRVARCLTKLRWTRRQVRTKSGREWRYVAPTFRDDDVAAKVAASPDVTGTTTRVVT